MSSQTAESSVSARLAAYDASRRAVAKKQGRPLPRMSNAEFNELHRVKDPRLVRFIHTTHTGDLAVTSNGTTSALTSETFLDIGTERTSNGAPFDFENHKAKDHGRHVVHTVFADPVTRAKAMQQLAALSERSDLLRAAYRRALWLDGMPAGTVLGTLTDMLSRRFWLPAGMDPDNLADWSVATGGVRTVTPGTIGDLLEHGGGTNLDREPRSRPLQRSLMRSVNTMSAAGSASYVYRGVESYNRAFKFADAVASTWAGAMSADSLLADRNIIAGITVRLTPAGQGPRTVRWKVEAGQPAFKEDSPVVLFTPTTETKTVFVEADVEGDDTYVSVARNMNAEDDEVAALHNRVTNTHEPVHAITQPFSLFPRGKTTRWTRAVEPVETGRDVPLDVVVAGAPTE